MDIAVTRLADAGRGQGKSHATNARTGASLTVASDNTRA
jgi:hypothetical protein